MKLSFRAAPILAMVAGLPAAVSEARAQSQDTIVVTGESAAEARKQARSYVRELGVAGSERPVARWLDPVCPRALGVSKEHAALIERQIRRTAERVGAPVASKACSSNFLVIFTGRADAFVSEIAKRHPRLWEPGSAPVRELKHGQAPIRWWYNTDVRTSSGGSEGADAMPGAKFTTFGGGEASMPGKSSTTVTNHYNSSLVSTQTVRAIHAATVVIDVQQAEGVRLKSVIDYAALVGLAEINLGSSPDDSILSLFESGSSRGALSHRDLAFLSGLYRIAMDRQGRLQRGLLVREMVRKTNTVFSD